MQKTATPIEVKGAGGPAHYQTVLRENPGLWDKRLVVALFISLAVHGLILNSVKGVKTRDPQQLSSAHRIPERVIRLMIDPNTGPTAPAPDPGTRTPSINDAPEPVIKPMDRNPREDLQKSARQAVADRARRVHNRLQRQGIIAMLVTSAKNTKSRIRATAETAPSIGLPVDLDVKLKRSQDLVSAKFLKGSRNKISSRELPENSRLVQITDQLRKLKPVPGLDLKKLGDITITRPTRVEGPATASVRRSQTALNEIVQKHRVQIRVCYRRFLVQNPQLQGKITVRFSILPGGSVDDVEIIENTTHCQGLAMEIMKRIKRWRFPEIPADQGSLRLSWPFIFQAG